MSATCLATKPPGLAGFGAREPTIVASRLSKRFGAVDAVKELDLLVRRGEIFGLVGPKGAGKSTTIKLLCTLTAATSGSAAIAGHDIVRAPDEVRRQIGVVFQRSTLDDFLSAEENLRLHAELYGVPAAVVAPRMEKLLDMVGLGDRRRALVSTLSFEMKRRLELARSLLHRPSVLLLDEPTLGLDPASKSELWRGLQAVRAESQLTILVVTQDLAEAERCDRIAVMDAGRVIDLGSLTALRARLTKERAPLQSDDDRATLGRLRQILGIETTFARAPR